MERCTECGNPLTEGACGTCAPTGRPVDHGERRRTELAAAHEKREWDRRVVARKVHERRKTVG